MNPLTLNDLNVNLSLITGDIAGFMKNSWARQYTPLEKVAIRGGVLYPIRRRGSWPQTPSALSSVHCRNVDTVCAATKHIVGGFTKRASRQVASGSDPLTNQPYQVPTKPQFTPPSQYSSCLQQYICHRIPCLSYIYGDLCFRYYIFQCTLLKQMAAFKERVVLSIIHLSIYKRVMDLWLVHFVLIYT